MPYITETGLIWTVTVIVEDRTRGFDINVENSENHAPKIVTGQETQVTEKNATSPASCDGLAELR